MVDNVITSVHVTFQMEAVVQWQSVSSILEASCVSVDKVILGMGSALMVACQDQVEVVRVQSFLNLPRVE